MPEESTEFSLIGLIGLIFGFMVVLVFFGLIFAQNVMTSVSDLKQSEQFDSFTSAIGEVCGSQYHTSVWQRSMVIFEEYTMQYADSTTDFADAEKVKELGCNAKCLCLLRNSEAIKCKSMLTYEQQDCRSAKVLQARKFWSNTDLDLPFRAIGEPGMGCKYRLTISWENGNVIVSGDSMELTKSEGKGSSWIWFGIGESC